MHFRLLLDAQAELLIRINGLPQWLASQSDAGCGATKASSGHDRLSIVTLVAIAAS
jgi:hypothetical protein